MWEGREGAGLGGRFSGRRVCWLGLLIFGDQLVIVIVLGRDH